jgi:hypothetical protein
MARKSQTKGKRMGGSSTKQKVKPKTRDFDPPVYCADPCPKAGCPAACVKLYGHSGVHRCEYRHTWNDETGHVRHEKT